jgi:hypothetical protein
VLDVGIVVDVMLGDGIAGGGWVVETLTDVEWEWALLHEKLEGDLLVDVDGYLLLPDR